MSELTICKLAYEGKAKEVEQHVGSHPEHVHKQDEVRSGFSSDMFKL